MGWSQKRLCGGRMTERLEDAMKPTLKTGRGHPGMQGASRSWKGQGDGSSSRAFLKGKAVRGSILDF